jgi:predicted NBD/HSP70 family sugar kinase
MLLHPTPKTPADVRRRNRFAVLSLLRDYGTLSKSEMVELTDLTNTTISTIVDDLVDEGLVRLTDEIDPNRITEIARGRPATQYRLNDDRWVVAGIQIASDTVTAVVLNLSGQVMSSSRLPAQVEMPAEVVLDFAANLLADLINRSLQGQVKLLGIGVALEGLVDVSGGLSLWMLLRTGWNNVPVKRYFEDRFDVPVLLDYRVYAAALAESYYGAARGISDFAYLNVDTGVAVASVASGRLVRSSVEPAGVTGGLGHVLNVGGHRLCYCGNTGCIQTEITTPALLTQLRELIQVSHTRVIEQFWHSRDLTFDNLIAAIQQDDPLALQLRDRFARNLAVAVRSVTLLFSANLVIMGGAAIQFGAEHALDAARHSVKHLSILHNLLGSTQVVASNLSPDSATVGAATLVIQAIMDGQITAPRLINE